jgi:hypothetical protein
MHVFSMFLFTIFPAVQLCYRLFCNSHTLVYIQVFFSFSVTRQMLFNESCDIKILQVKHFTVPSKHYDSTTRFINVWSFSSTCNIQRLHFCKEIRKTKIKLQTQKILRDKLKSHTSPLVY